MILSLTIILFFLVPFVASKNIQAASNDQDTKIEYNAKEPIDSAEVEEIAFWDENYGQISKVVIDDTKAYVCLSNNGFVALDISDESNPEVLIHWDFYGCNDIAVANDKLFVGNNSGIYVLDATDYNQLTVISNITWFEAIRDIEVIGNYTFITSFTGFYSFNFTDLSNPSLADTYIQNNLDEIKISNNIAYVVDNNAFRIINVTDAYDVDLLYTISYGEPRDLFCLGNYLYLSTESEAFIYNVTDLTFAPDLLDEYTYNETGSQNIWVTNNKLIVSYEDRLELIDVTNKTNMLYDSQFISKEEIIGLEIIDDLAIIFNKFSIEILDISNLGAINSVNYEQYYGNAYGIFIEDNYAYIANDISLKIIDISDSMNPTTIGTFYDQSEDWFDIYVHNDFAYILQEGFGLRIIEVTDPTNPIERGNISIGGTYYDLHVSDEYVYVALGNDGLAIIDIYYPDYPQISMIYEEIPTIYAVDMIDETLFAAADTHFHLIDMSNPYVPEKVSNWTRTNAFYYGLSLRKDYAYVTSWEGFDIIDIKDYKKPVKVGQYFTYELPYYIDTDGQYIYTLDNVNGLNIYDATNIAHPKLISNYEYEDGFMHSINAQDGVLYTTTELDGIRILGTTPLLTARFPLMNPITVFLSILLASSIVLLVRRKRK